MVEFLILILVKNDRFRIIDIKLPHPFTVTNLHKTADHSPFVKSKRIHPSEQVRPKTNINT